MIGFGRTLGGFEIGCRYRRGPWFTAYRPPRDIGYRFGWLWSSNETGCLFTIGYRWMVVGVGWQRIRVCRPSKNAVTQRS